MCRYLSFFITAMIVRVKCQIYTTRVTTPRISSNLLKKKKYVCKGQKFRKRDLKTEIPWKIY